MNCRPWTTIEFRSPGPRQPVRPTTVVKQSLIQLLKRAVGATLLGATMLTSAEELPRLAETIKPDLRNLIIKDVQGTNHQPLAAAGQKATVFFFVLSDCPIANSYAPEINRIVADYTARGVRSYVVYVEDDLSTTAACQHAQDHDFKFPALLDPGHQLVKFAQVTVSPEVAVLAPDNAVLYRGRIDDRAAAFGKRRMTPSKRDLREALDAILDGKPVATPVTKAVGCYIATNENPKLPQP
jgi:peroxiredoxin